ncbi:MAG: hypothetical protein ACXVJW_18495 [Acidimicrobiia bacterium]
MPLATIDSDPAATIVAVLGAVATARGTQTASEADRAVIRAAATAFLGGPEVPEELASSIPGEVAEALATPESRELTLTIASVLCFADVTVSDDAKRGFLDPVRATVMDDLARYLRVSALEVIEIRHLTKYHRDRVAFDLFRRFPITPHGDDTTTVHAAMLRTETRLDIDARHVHALWEQTEALPEGTVGAELIRYYRDNDWHYPGTDHHQPLMFAEHDFHHVLGGYATTPAGELQLGAFIAGVARRPMDAARIFLTWEQLGVGSTSIADPLSTFDADSFRVALERGTRTTESFIGDGWDPWSIVERDVVDVRADYAIGEGAQLEAGEPYDRDPITADR